MSKRRISNPSPSTSKSTKRKRIVVQNDDDSSSDEEEVEKTVSRTHRQINTSGDSNNDSIDEYQNVELYKEMAVIEGSVRSGKILKMQLKNFMCHTNLVVDFNLNITIIVGNNGSGKSAILTALALGLGSRALTTSRSNSIKQLVKSGQPSATIEIHLMNEGYDSYEPEVYGKKIIVTRHITASGSSSYTIRNAQKEKISASKSDLSKMLLYLNIQVENPVSVLNQEASRTFLKECDEKTRYKLYLKATHIETISEKLNDCLVSYISSKNTLANLNKAIVEIELSKQECEIKLKKLQSAERLKEEIKSLRNEINWINVIQQESLLEDVNLTLEKNESILQKLSDKMNNRTDGENEVKSKIREIEIIIADKNRLLQEYDTKYDAERRDYTNENNNFMEQNRALKQLLGKKQRIETDIVNTENEILKITSSNSSDALRKKNDEKLLQFETKLEDISTLFENSKRELDMMQGTLQQMREAMDDFQRKKKSCYNEISQTNAQLRQLEGSNNDSLHVYGPNMPGFIKALEKKYNSKGFKDMPLGPIGRYIEVIDKKNRPVVETILGGMLQSFVVSNVEDRKTLEHLMRQSNIRASIITTKFGSNAYDISRGMCRAVQNTELLYSAIRVTNTVIMNILIDHIHIETILLSEDDKLVEKLSSQLENVPRNLQKIYTLSPMFEYYPAPKYRLYPCNDRPPRYIQVNTTDLKNSLESNLSKYTNVQKSLENEIKLLERQLQTHENTRKEKQGLMRSLESKITSLKSQINEIKLFEYPSSSSSDILKNEVNELKKQYETVEQSIENEKTKVGELTILVKAREQDLKNIKKKSTEISTEMSDLKSKVDLQKDKLHKITSDATYGKVEFERRTNLLNQTKAAKDEILKKKNDVDEKAKKSGPRIDSERTIDEVKSAIAKLDQKIKQKCQVTENIDDITTEFKNICIQLEKETALSVIIMESLKNLKKARTQRFSLINDLKRNISIRVKFAFQNLLNLRGYKGELKIDDTKGILDLIVVPRDSRCENAVSSTKSLSGGERSFTTVAFLIALWKSVDFPFYFLDEYDVFTDQVNRSYITKLLIGNAEAIKTRQYVFLTPQDMSEFKSSDLLSIIKMEPPNRRPN